MHSLLVCKAARLSIDNTFVDLMPLRKVLIILKRSANLYLLIFQLSLSLVLFFGNSNEPLLHLDFERVSLANLWLVGHLVYEALLGLLEAQLR